MLGGKRLDRVGEILKAEIGSTLLMKVKDPRLGFVTITRVLVSPDLRNARVYFSVLGDQQVRDKTLAALESSKGFLQHEIAEVIKMKVTPKLSFVYDSSAEYAMKIESIINEIHDEKETD